MTARSVPVVTHRLKDGIIELDGPGNEQGGVFFLSRHCGIVVGGCGLLEVEVVVRWCNTVGSVEGKFNVQVSLDET